MPAALPAADEREAVRRWRYAECRAAGLTRLESRLFAEGDGDLRLLRMLVKNGATGQQCAKVLL